VGHIPRIRWHLSRRPHSSWWSWSLLTPTLLTPPCHRLRVSTNRRLDVYQCLLAVLIVREIAKTVDSSQILRRTIIDHWLGTRKRPNVNQWVGLRAALHLKLRVIFIVFVEVWLSGMSWSNRDSVRPIALIIRVIVNRSTSFSCMTCGVTHLVWRHSALGVFAQGYVARAIIVKCFLLDVLNIRHVIWRILHPYHQWLFLWGWWIELHATWFLQD